MATAVLAVRGLAGAVALFVFFAAMFNGLTALMMTADAVGLVTNFSVSMRVGDEL